MRAALVIALVSAVAAAVALRAGGGALVAPAAAGGGARGFAAVSLSDCADWRAAKIDRRLRLVADLGDHFGHASHVWGGATLASDEARRTLEATCAAPEARDIKLYKIYARALSFRGLARD